MKALILFYSVYGHNFKIAKSIANGLEAVGLEPVLRKAPETLSDEILEKIAALEKRKEWAHIPDVTNQDLLEAQAIIIGSPTRFGGLCGQIRSFLDSTGGLFAKGELVGKVGAMFTSSNTQHGGQESTILSSIPFFLHHGMVFVGLPAFIFPKLRNTSEINGCSPYGVSTICGKDGLLQPTEIDIEGAKVFGEHIGRTTKKLRG